MITRTAIKGNLKLLQQVLLGNSTPLGATCYTFFSFQLIGFYTKATEGFPRLETAIVKCNLARSNFIWFHSCQLTHCAKPTIFVFWRQFQFRISGLKWMASAACMASMASMASIPLWPEGCSEVVLTLEPSGKIFKVPENQGSFNLTQRHL